MSVNSLSSPMYIFILPNPRIPETRRDRQFDLQTTQQNTPQFFQKIVFWKNRGLFRQTRSLDMAAAPKHLDCQRRHPPYRARRERVRHSSQIVRVFSGLMVVALAPWNVLLLRP